MIEEITELQPSVALFNLPLVTAEHKEGYNIKINELAYSKALKRLPSVMSGEITEKLFSKRNPEAKTLDLLNNNNFYELSILSREEEQLYFKALRFFEFILDPKQGIEKLNDDAKARVDHNLEEKKRPKLPFFEEEELKYFLNLLNERVGLEGNTNIEILENDEPFNLLNSEIPSIDEKRRYQKGVEEILENIKTLIQFSNIKLVKKIIIGISNKNLLNLEEREEIFQESFIALREEAIKNFNHTLNFKFSTSATWFIRSACQTYLFDNARTIKIPHHKNKVFRDIQQLIAQATQKEEANLNPSAIEQLLKSSSYSKKVIQAFQFFGEQDTLSIDEENDKKPTEMNDNIIDISDHSPTNPETILSNKQSEEEVFEIFLSSGLTPQETLAIYTRLGFLTVDKMSYKDIAKIMSNIPLHKIAALLKKGLEKLKTPTPTNNPKIFKDEASIIKYILSDYNNPTISETSQTTP